MMEYIFVILVITSVRTQHLFLNYHCCFVISEGGTLIVLVCVVYGLLMQHPLVPGTLPLTPLWSVCVRRASFAVTSASDVTMSLARHTWAPLACGQTSSACRVDGWQKRRARELTPRSQRTAGSSKEIQGGSNMTGTDLCVNKPYCAVAVRP